MSCITKANIQPQSMKDKQVTFSSIFCSVKHHTINFIRRKLKIRLLFNFCWQSKIVFLFKIFNFLCYHLNLMPWKSFSCLSLFSGLFWIVFHTICPGEHLLVLIKCFFVGSLHWLQKLVDQRDDYSKFDCGKILSHNDKAVYL